MILQLYCAALELFANLTALQVKLTVLCKVLEITSCYLQCAATFEPDLTGKKLTWQRCCLLLLPGFINQFSFIYNVLLIIKSGISYGLTKFSLGNTHSRLSFGGVFIITHS